MVRESPDSGAANTAPHRGDCGGCRRDRLAAAREGQRPPGLSDPRNAEVRAPTEAADRTLSIRTRSSARRPGGRLPSRRTSGPDRARCVPRPRRPGRRVGVTRCRRSEAITERASTNRTAACWRSTGPGLRGWMFGRAADRLHGQLGLVCPSWVSRPSSGEDLFRVAPCRDWVIGATRPPAFGDGILAVAKPRPDDRRAGGVARSESFKAWEPASAGGSALPARTPLIRPGSLALRLASAENRCPVPLPVTPAGANSKTKSPGLHNITVAASPTAARELTDRRIPGPRELEL